MGRRSERSAKREYWQEQFKKWQESGLNQTLYCREHELSLNRFVYWKKRLCPDAPSLRLVELPLLQPSGTIAVVVDGRYRVEIAPGFDPQSLALVLRTVSSL